MRHHRPMIALVAVLALAAAGCVVPGQITTAAGTGTLGFNGDIRAATSAQLNEPFGVAVDGNGNIYIADTYNQRVRRVRVTGQITTAAGTGTQGFNGDNQAATSSQLAAPRGIAVDGGGNLYIADTGNERVRRVDKITGQITTVAGNGGYGFNGDNQPATTAQLKTPYGVAVDSSGNVYIADTFNERVRRVDALSQQITTAAGTGIEGFNGDTQPGSSAQVAFPYGVAVDGGGRLYIADAVNQRVRRVDVTGQITTAAGTGTQGFNGDNQAATSAKLTFPAEVAFDRGGNLYISDTGNYRVRRVDAVTQQIITVAGSGVRGFNGDNQPAISTQLNYAYGVAVDRSGTLYVADTGNQRVRRGDGGVARQG